MSRSWAGGSTRHQRRIRNAVIARDTALGYGCRTHEDGWCTRANTKEHTCTHRPEEVHHTLGKAVTGDDPDHQITACQTCNLAIGDPTKNADPTPRPMTQW